MVASVASVVAAVVTRELFDAGVVASAAITPVVVALVSDGMYMAASGRARQRAPDTEPATGSPGGAPATGSQPPPPPRPRRLPILGAILIGLLAFVIAVLVLTIPEAVNGTSITGSDEQTTFFGSNEDKPWNTGDQFRNCFDSFKAFGDCLDQIFG
ncbi:MAG TPA: hypothetical protein VF056_05150 [Thermoleophilaceae bacterium]